MSANTPQITPPQVKQETFSGSFKTWLYQVYTAIQNIGGGSGNTIINGSLTVTGPVVLEDGLTVDGNVTVTGVVTDAQTYTRNLGIYHGLLGE